MFDYKSRIALGGAIAVILGLSLGLGVTFLPTGGIHNSSSTTSSLSTVSGTMSTSLSSTVATAESSSTVTPATTTMSGTATISISSSTSGFQNIITSNPVPLDPSLDVNLTQSVLLDTNATAIAQRFASSLGQSLIGSPNVTQGYQSNYYSYKTDVNSTIVVSFAPNLTQLTYTIHNWAEQGNGTTVNSGFNASAAGQYAETTMDSVGIPTANMNLTNVSPSLTPNDYVIQWVESYQGIPFLGSLTKNPDGSYFFSGSSAFFDFNPSAATGAAASGELKEAIFVNPYWYIVPGTFPLKVSADNASCLAEDYAVHVVGMNLISSVQINFATVQGHLYYVVTLSGSSLTYEIFVDPSNGQVGFPE